MLVESIAIFILFLILIFIFLRKRQKYNAISACPILILPFIDIVMSILNFEYKWLHPIMLIVSMAASLVLIGLFSNYFKKVKSKMAYILITGGFITTITVIYIYNILPV